MRILITIALIITSAVTGFAQLSDPIVSEVTITSMIRDKYTGDQGAVFYEHPVSNTDFSVTFRNGMFAGVWVSTGFNGRKDFDKELDLYVGYSRAIQRFQFSTDFEYFAIQGIDIVNLNGDLSLGPAFVRLEGYAPVKQSGPSKGLIASLGLKHEFNLGERFSFEIGGRGKYDSGSFGYEKAWLAQGTGILNFRASSKVTLIAEAELSKPIKALTDGRKREATFGGGISYSFR